MSEFINSEFMWNDFLQYVMDRGYSEEEIDEATENLYT